ncbi:PAS domain-containing protein, partial [Desulfobacterales bacterium HSG17]|nr:PAS domain-containing protein [Desulfobacterales bacterium HSG17]
MINQPIKKELEAAQRTVRFFEALLRASSDGIVITDATQNIIVTNEAFCSLFGASLRSVLETNLLVWLNAHFGNNAQQRWADLEKQVHLDGECCDIEFML